jgi:phosphoglucosamine mutase
MFGTSGIRGRVGDEVTAALALSVGRAVGSDVGSGSGARAVIGRDPRDSGRLLADAVSAGLRECGVDVVDLGPAATPTVARGVGWRDADVGVSITASHNPPEDNGLKLWSPSGQAFDEARRERIAGLVETADYGLRPWDDLGSESTWDGATGAHAAVLVEAIDVGDRLSDLSVVVDVGNGAGGVTADALHELGCDVETLNAQPDGRFPGRPSEPTAETLESLCRHVGATDADLGIAHDGDADRAMAVDGDGEFVPGDLLLALFGRAAAGPGDRVAAPVNTSLAVDDALAAVGAEVTRTRVGDVYVAERATERDVVFGGEPSGAWIWPDETLCPDGPLAACKLVELVAREGPLAAQLETIDGYPIRRESVEVEEKRALLDRVATDVDAEYDDVSTADGVRVDRGDGWFLIRASGTQPLVRLTAEARDPDRADELLATAREIVARNRD